MKELLEACVRLDEYAADTYDRLTDAVPDGKVKGLLGSLAAEERVHVDWWKELQESWDNGLLPDLVGDSERIASELKSRERDIRALVDGVAEPIDERTAVSLAARLEFYMLFPVFGELIDLVEPTQAHVRHNAYRHHLDHVVEAIALVEEGDPLVGFLAQVLQRVGQDNRTLSAHATRDDLTGLRNRRALDGHLRQWLAWSSRYARPLGVLLVDLDELKHVNDAMGHATGDRVLVDTALAMQKSVRSSDMVARYGGDEFVVIAPEAGIEELRALAERLASAVREVRVMRDGHIPVKPTVSVGSAVMLPSKETSPTPEQLLSAADESLYSAKESGRDRIGPTLTLPDMESG